MRTVLQSGTLALVLWAILSPATLAADTKNDLGVPNATINTTYFSADFMGALVVQPRNLLAHPTLAKSPIGEMLGKLETEFGFDPRKLDEAIFAMGQRSEGGAEGLPREAFGVILRNSVPFDRAKFPQNLRDAKETQVDGQKYFAAGNPWQASYAMPNDRTLVFASEGDLKKMLTLKNPKSPLIEAIAKADRKKPANLVVSIAPIRKLAQLDGANQAQLPPPLDTFLKMVELVDVVEVSVNASDLAVDATLRTKNVDNADQILGFTNTLLGLATLGIDQLIEQVKQAPPAQRREAEPALTLTKEVLKKLKPAVQGTNVVVSIDGKTSEDAVTKAVAMIVPQIEKARSRAEHLKTTNNLRQILLAVHNHADVHNAMPGNVTDKAGKPLLSWRVKLLPYLEQQALYEQFKMDEAWDSPHNKKLLEKMPDAFKANNSKAPAGKTTFQCLKGKDTVLGGDKPLTFAQIVDGTSNTIMVVDTADDQAVEWTKPDDFAYDPQKPAAGLAGHLPGKILVGFADGSVRILSEKIDPEMLRRAITASDGKVVELPNDFDDDAAAAGGATFNEVTTTIEAAPAPAKKADKAAPPDLQPVEPKTPPKKRPNQ